MCTHLVPWARFDAAPTPRLVTGGEVSTQPGGIPGSVRHGWSKTSTPSTSAVTTPWVSRKVIRASRSCRRSWATNHPISRCCTGTSTSSNGTVEGFQNSRTASRSVVQYSSVHSGTDR